MAAASFMADDLRDFAASALRQVSCPEDEATLVAGTLVDADARGLHSHGLLRLPLYVETVQSGGIVPGAPMEWLTERPATALLDAAYGFGQSAMQMAVDRVAELAGSAGCATVAVRRSTHYGTGAYWGIRLAERGLAGLVASNTGPCVAPFGSREPLLGTNPVTLAFPVEDDEPICLDMATSQAAYGKVVAARADQQPIPPGWAVGPEGEPTTDPDVALEGALLPFGGHKGSGLATVVEVLTAGLAGALFSYEITDMWADRRSRMGTGHLAVALDPGAFGDAQAFAARTRELVQRFRRSDAAQDFDSVRMPGEIEQERAKRSFGEGITLPAELPSQLDSLASELGLTPPVTS